MRTLRNTAVAAIGCGMGLLALAGVAQAVELEWTSTANGAGDIESPGLRLRLVVSGPSPLGAAAASGLRVRLGPIFEEHDSDSDGYSDAADNCPDISNVTQADVDADGVGDACDNCTEVSNASQHDGDDDGAGDACDPCPADPSDYDPDSDGKCAAQDNCPLDSNPGQEDVDHDGYGDACEDEYAEEDPNSYADAPEICDGIDNDGDSLIDEGTGCVAGSCQ